MIIGRVIGNVVSSRKYDSLQGYKLLLIRPQYTDKSEVIVAADVMGAGVGQQVIVSFGESNQHALTKNAPIDALVVGIVDNEPVLDLSEQP
ncbi:EutN/CcmL family microcompartment protein [Paenibacillus lutimineralis]|uniref:Ethanolamine utilization protein EutN n=1 Tax=Paenibacillus lutimineralis TaxID=2707005 RepID=A0A3Q9ICA3_9BACL|nr:EutN/CcmL family microcompartment protein [Paenibacillus lutimineralis]AZS17627.1 ethanolamine utilization protein EutN [Paenibacillus lutimineralis]